MEEEIKKVNSAIEKCEGEIKIAASNVLQSTGEDKQYWMKEVQALRVKENALMVKENALMVEKKPVNEVNLLPKYSEGI